MTRMKVLGRKRTQWVVVRDSRKSIRRGAGLYVGSFRYHLRIMPRTMFIRIKRFVREGRRIRPAWAAN